MYTELHDMVSKLPSAQPDHIAEVSKKDIPSVQPEQAAREMKAEDVPEINVGKMKALSYDQIKWERDAAINQLNDLGCTFGKNGKSLYKQLHILADALDGCPLTDPCDKLWAPHGWCEEHCREKQFAPSKECWLKYAEVMASEG